MNLRINVKEVAHLNVSGAGAVNAEETFSNIPMPVALSGVGTFQRRILTADYTDERGWEMDITTHAQKSTGSAVAAPHAQSLCVVMPGAEENYSAGELEEAQGKAELCRRFIELTGDVKRAESEFGVPISGNQAAGVLGKAASWFSRYVPVYRAQGVMGLLPARRACGRKKELFTDLPAWFLPVAKFYYLLSNRDRTHGSVPEAIRRTISLPACPPAVKGRLLNVCRATDAKVAKAQTPLPGPLPIGCGEGEDGSRGLSPHQPRGSAALPECPKELREAILRREKAGMPMLTEHLMREIAAAVTTVGQYRNGKNASLNYLNAPGTQMWARHPETGDKFFIRGGDVIEPDDATINFPVCVPWKMGGCPSSEKFGVKAGRFQWLVSIDVGSRLVTGWSYTARPRSSYRGEDVLSMMRGVARQHGVPRYWRMEKGVWRSNLVKEAVRLMGSQRWEVHSPHNKPFIENLFNRLWTKLAVWFPESQVGRFRGENEHTNEILRACQAGQKDPRRYFPMLVDVVQAFEEVIAEVNRTPVVSDNWGTWVPEERWGLHLSERPLRRLDGQTDWIFSPFVREWTVRGMLVGGKVAIFEDLSVPYDFSAPWMAQYHGARVRCYFDPRDPKCFATVCLAQAWGNRKAGDVLGLAEQINETTGYVRLVMGWGEDSAQAGLLARQKAAAAMRREVRAVLPRNTQNTQKGFSESEERDGVSKITRIFTEGNEVSISGDRDVSSGTTSQGCGDARSGTELHRIRSGGMENSGAEFLRRTEEAERWERENAGVFV